MINSQAKLTGLKVSEPKPLTPPEQLLNKNTVPVQNIQVELLPEADKTPTKSSLSKNDDISGMINLASAGLAGGIGAAKAAQNVGIIGESMRGMQVQQSMTEMQSRMYDNRGGYNNNNYNNNNSYNYGTDYNNEYGSTERYGRGSYGRSEALFGQSRYGRSEYDGYGSGTSPEMSMAFRNIANGTFQGAKYGSIIGGSVSAVVNAYKVITGKEKGSEAVGGVAADTVTAGVSGASGALTGGFASLGLGIIGIGGMPGLVLASGLGVVGAVVSQYLLQKSGIYDSLKQKVVDMVTGKK